MYYKNKKGMIEVELINIGCETEQIEYKKSIGEFLLRL